MKFIFLQTLFLGAYLAFLLVMRVWARDSSMRQNEEERKQRAALEREWKVGIPYDPES